MDNTKKRAVALGFFDGLHAGHLAVLKPALAQKEKGLVPAVLLFDEHPLTVLKGEKIARLMSSEKREKMLTEMGFEIIKYSFSAIKDMSAQDFVKKVLKEQLKAGFVSCGFNYRFAKNGTGTTATLESLCGKEGIEACVCPRITVNGETVCSTAIRKAATTGDMKTVLAMLGRPLEFCTTVFSGDHRGRLLGAPTINQYLPENFIEPRFGVYASTVELDGKTYMGVTNIGNRPTFDGVSVRSETFILDFEGDLYGRLIDVKLYAFIREEMKFSGFDELKERIAVDASEARKILTEMKI